MLARIKRLWTGALRSGRYRQGTGALRRQLPGGEAEYCCLGVLCDLYAAETGRAWEPFPSYRNDWAMHGRADVLPREVADWAGLADVDPLVLRGGSYVHLSTLNDEEMSFAGIAGLIEEHL